VLKDEEEWRARMRHQSSTTCMAATVTLFAESVGWTRATDHSRSIKAAGLLVRYLPSQSGGDRPTRAPWAKREVVEAAKLLSKVRCPAIKRQCWLPILAYDAALRESARAARRLGGPQAVKALMEVQEVADG
jgi:hypothetical protein